MKQTTSSSDLPENIRDDLDRISPVTGEVLAELAAANRAIQDDPSFEADVIKMVFINEMLDALNSRGETKPQLADRLGKSRQYIHKLFNEDKRVNFTVDTLCNVAHALGRRIHLHVCSLDEEPMILSTKRSYESIHGDALWPDAARRSTPMSDEDYTNISPFPASEAIRNDYINIA